MTNVQIKNLSDTKRELEIHIKKEDLTSFYKKAYQKVGGKAKIPGFRAGKIPNSVLDRHYGAEVEFECVNFVVGETYQEALKEHKLLPLLEPKFDVGPLVREADYKYKVEIEVKPAFELKPYKEIKIKTPSEPVTAAEIETELNQLLERMAESVPAEDDAILGPGFVAVIDFEGKIEGVPFAGGTAKGYNLHFGKGSFLKSFEDQILGAKKGEARAIKVAFPADYFEKSLAGKTADFDVVIQALQVKKLPALDDEFAKDVGKENVAQLKADIEKHLQEIKKNKIKPKRVEEIKEHILKAYSFEVPKGLIDHQMAQACQNHDHDHDHKDHKHPTAQEIEADLRFEFVLEAIALAESIKPTPEEIHGHLMYYAQVYRKPLPEIQNTFLNNGMMPHVLARITLDKTLDFIIQHAKM